MEHRKHERVHVEYTASFSGERFHALGDIVDLSLTGCRGRSACSIKKHEGVTVLMHIPRYEVLFSIPKAVVRWSDGLNLGVEFVQMEPNEQQRLRELIQAIKAALPTKDRRPT